MTGSDVIRKIGNEGTGGYPFIKWWRNEQDWVDIDLVERFVAGGGRNLEIGGYTLASEEEIWEEAKRLCGDRLARDGDRILWRRGDRVNACSYTPENILTVLDVETRGNHVD